MCLSVPAQIVSVDGDFAEVSVNGALFRAGIHMIEDPQPGEYILLHAGFAIQKISDQEAEETLGLWKELDSLSEKGNVFNSKGVL
jgi:hydrogenase expression/formation protein HypC